MKSVRDLSLWLHHFISKYFTNKIVFDTEEMSKENAYAYIRNLGVRENSSLAEN